MVCGWAERSFMIGGIAWHKVEDLEKRLGKMIPIQGKLNKSRVEHVKLLYRAWAALSDLVELENRSKGPARSSLSPTREQWENAFDKARAIFKEHDNA